MEWLYSGVTKTKPSNEAIFVGPALGVRLAVLAERRRHGLVEERQVEVREVDELELGVAALLGEVVDPPGDGFAVAAGAGAAEDDADLDHFSCSFCFAPEFAIEIGVSIRQHPTGPPNPVEDPIMTETTVEPTVRAGARSGS